MKFGIVLSYGSVHDYVDLAREAEASGWVGVFAWDDISVDRDQVFDPWVVLGAMAVATERVTLGAMVFSHARRRPWKVARESITLDLLSNGRLVMPVGLGGDWDVGYSRVNTDEPAIRVRAEKLDECAARWDGVIATDRSGSDESGTTSPEAVAGTVSGIGQHRREASPFDVVVEGVTSGADKRSDREILQSLADAGATWWIESRWGADQFAATLHDRIRRGPPTFG